ncbi:transcription factor LHW-like isoform X1 [Curcuma longa]|uniref:transcription factor LHW-like isoform X1 n=1 Tax=Curcuma longa TaxID=136217 RepID=UPI003D9E5BF1
MGMPLREGLKRLCLESGWSYAVIWKPVVFERRVHLIWQDGYCNKKPNISSFKISNFLHKEEDVGIKSDGLELGCEKHDGTHALVHKILASQVHLVGDGLIGQAALSGKYKWINTDKFSSESEGLVEINCQIEAGMQTIVIVPVLPYGIIQLGSTQMVIENIGLVQHIKCLFAKLDYVSSDVLSSNTQKSWREDCQIYSSHGPALGSHSQNPWLNVDEKLHVIANQCNTELLNSPTPRSFSESVSLIPSQLNMKIPSSDSEVVPTELTAKMAYPLGKLILQSADYIFPKAGIQPTSQIPPDDSKSECQNRHSDLNSFLLPNNLNVLEEELMFASAIGAFESTNVVYDISNASSTTNPHRVTKSSTSSAVIETTSNLGQRAQALKFRNTCISEVSRKDQPFLLSEGEQSQSNLEIKENDDLVQASHVFSSESKVACSDMLSGILQEHAISYSKPVWNDQIHENVDYVENDTCRTEIIQCTQDLKEYRLLPSLKSRTLFASENDMFHMLDADHKIYWTNGSLADVVVHKNSTNVCDLGTDVTMPPEELDACPNYDSLNEQISCSGLFPIDDKDQLLDAVITKINLCSKQGSDGNVSQSAFMDPCSSRYAKIPSHSEAQLSNHKNDEPVEFSPLVVKLEPSCISYSKSSCSFEKDGEYTQKSGFHKPQINAQVESCQSAMNDCASDSNSKRVSEVGKLNRKRPRPAESPRPRPKDRQLIQDRIKELREIVPNGAKCSIDALLEKTIKHMFFLQSVTTHADKLKVSGEPKISNEEGGLLMKDNFEDGATWAFEVGTQPMICPIVVEDLNPPRQLLVEMLCKERGSFLEIADFIRGLGLTILKGVMEARKSKVWARFAVEANRDVTRMEIFLSLVQLLEPSAGSNMALHTAGNINMAHAIFQQTSVPARVI